MRTLIALGFLIVLAGCASGSLRRDLDVSGDLPRVLTLGSFAPMCLMFCFPTTNVTQGDVVHEDIPDGLPYTVHSHTSGDVKVKTPPKQKGLHIKPKAQAAPATPPSP